MSQKEKEIDIRSWIIRIFKNWYWFMLSCVVFGAIGAYVYVSTTKKFKVDASIMLRSEEEAIPQFEMITSIMGMSNSKTTDDEVELLISRDILWQVVNELDLQTEYRKLESFKWMGQYPGHDLTVVYPPQYVDTMSRSVKIELKVRKNDYLVKVRYGRWTRSRHTVKDITKPFTTCIGPISFKINSPQAVEVGDKYRMMTLPMLPLIDSYKQNVTAAPVRKESNIINLSTTTDMPIRGRDFIRKEIELYNMDAVLDKNIMASNTAAFIEERLRLIEEELAEAEQDVAKYKRRFDILDLESEAALAVQEGAEFKKQIAEIETQLNLVGYVSEYVSDETKKNNLIPSNIGINDPSLVGLIGEYNQLMLDRMRVSRTASESNPILTQMESQLSVMRENIVTTISSVTSTLSIAKRDIEKRQGQIQVQRNQLPSQEKEYVEVMRNKVLKEELYLFLYKQREENALTLASTVNPAKLVNAPQMNPTPVEPRLSLIGIVCLILGLVFPLAIMIVYDIMNNRISDEATALERRLKIPLAGSLVKNHHGGHIAVHEGENSASAELFRTLRTNLRFMQKKDCTCPVMLVTSSVNGEGKSYVATNLAISLSLLGKRVALVGLDIRKPMLASYLNLPSQGCLTSYVAEDAYTIEDIIVPSGIANLDILPAGVVPPNPSELLQSERLDELMAELRQRYDYVIVDTAPIALVGDTYLLHRLADMTVYVTRANYTTYELVDLINQTHEQQRLPKMVAVLNGVNAKKVGYGYGYGYGNDVKGRR
ncbi:MAG: polysaccharide biosynthesis tyrosine autokinase [Paludibacteraceae bacterium]|nr:polysaccharide biosynthesis tyrosine autokinase [Paludibacteraceae bacterium]